MLRRALLLMAVCVMYSSPAAAQSLRQEFPYPKAAVYQALVETIPALGYRIKAQDAVISRVTASAGMSLTSWGQDMSFAVSSASENESVIEYASTRRLGTNVNDFGRGQKIFDKVVLAVSQRLQASQTADAGPLTSPTP